MSLHCQLTDSSQTILESDSTLTFLRDFVQRTMPMSLRRFVGASDLLQSVWIRLHRSRQYLQQIDEIQFKNWARCVVRRKIVDCLRRYHLTTSTSTRNPRLTPPAGGRSNYCTDIGPEQILALNEQAGRVLDALSSLPADIREIVTLRYTEELTFSEISNRLSIPTTTCRRRWLEGCEILRERLVGILQ